eukprot:64584-Hanusia_phi.AAC.1
MLYGVENIARIVDAGVQAGLVPEQGLPRTRQNVSQHSPWDHHMGDLELTQSRSGAWQGFSMSQPLNDVCLFNHAVDGIMGPQQVRQHHDLSGAASAWHPAPGPGSDCSGSG